MKVIPYPLKEFKSDLKDECRDIDGKRPKRPNLRFATADGELQVLSVYTDGADIWVDLERPVAKRARRAKR